MGYIDNKHQIEIHKRACPVADKLKTSFGNRILDAKWDMHKHVNIHKLTISSEEGVFDGSIELRVHDREDVKAIMKALKAIDGLQEVAQIM